MSRKLVRVVSVAFGAIPFAFGALRALQTGSDVRYLVTAFASFAAAATIMRLTASLGRGRASTLLRSILVLGGATLVAGAAAFGLGAKNAPAIWLVAVGFSLCATASLVLGLSARPERG